MNNPSVKLSNIYKSFGTLNVINNISLSFQKGKMTSIIGCSGSGKTTLLNIIGTLEKPDSGTIEADGTNISAFSSSMLAEYRNRTVGFVFQSFYLEPAFTVYKNVELPLLIRGDQRSHKERIEKVLSTVGLSEKIKADVSKLSGGEQQRVCIARALIAEPKILLCDEPCGNLDRGNSRIIMKLLREQTNNGTTVIMVTHNLEDAEISDRIIEIRDGTIISDRSNNV